ncbi:MAG: hypothetical protein LQ346_007842 [Caloplaca aetnensis]|nr:MAG: hypothetical protein LQ346_007842 [Caloplaca aetnensis]
MPPSQTRYRWTQLVATTTTLSHLVALVSANCFLPNSTDRNTIWDAHGSDYQPIGFGSSTDNFQMCCATNGRAVPDIPRKDGLCQNNIAIWRESCTDPTWKSPSCIKLCIDGINDEGDHRRDVDNRVTQCPDLSYCCDDRNITCCQQGNGVWIENGQPTTINPNAPKAATVSATPISATTPAGLPPPLPLVSPAPPQSAGLAGGAIAGIAVGAIAGTIIPALAIWLCILRARKRRRDNIDAKIEPDIAPQPVHGHGPPAEMNAPDSRYLYPYTQNKDGTLRWELSGHSGRDVLRVELAGEDPVLQTKKENTELVGSMPAYQELQ